MKIHKIASNLVKIGNYYKNGPADKQGKKYTFYKAARNLTSAFDPNKIVSGDYDFTSIEGIGEGIQSRIVAMINGDYVKELVMTIDSAIQSLPSDVIEQLQLVNVYTKEDLLDAVSNTRTCHGIPDEAIALIGRQRVTENIKYIVSSITCDLAAANLEVDIAGSYRRGLPTVKDLDFLVFSEDEDKVDKCLNYLQGKTDMLLVKTGEGKVMRRYTIFIDGVGIKVDIKVVPPKSKGTALLHFTGPASFNIAIRSKISSLRYCLNEYSLTKKGDDINLVSGFSEDQVRQYLNDNLDIFIPAPEYRK